MKPDRARHLALLCILVFAMSFAQVPTGTIAGVVSDPSGAVIPSARITITNLATGLSRAVTAGDDGVYSAAALPAGRYEVQAAAPGMSKLVRTATVETGSTTTVDMLMLLGSRTDVVSVHGASPQIRYEGYNVAGVVARFQIENLPLNGRNFLELAKLEPGVTVAATSSGGANSQFQVSVLGAPTERTRVTVDGGDVLNYMTGGNALNLSQELVQEFQISTVNFDVSTGVTSTGAINIVTRSGGNDYHGSAYYLFRDRNLASYPALARQPLNPDPFFARRQTGFYFGGPIRKDRLFFFTNLEHDNQDSVVTVQPRAPEFSRFSQIVPSPFDSKQLSARFDMRLNDRNNFFARYSHEGNRSFSPPFGAISLPSNWLRETNWSDQSIAALTTVLRPDMVNDLRFAYTYWQIRDRLPTASDCSGNCIGLGWPRVEVLGTGLLLGNYDSGGADLRRFITTENLTWQRGSHRMHFGLEWESYRSAGSFNFFEPASMLLYAPETVRLHNADPRTPPSERIPLPTEFRSLDDILRLPLVSFVTGIGDPSQPPPFQADIARKNNRWLFYWNDAWRLRPRFTMTYGLRYSYETNALNHDLDKPQYVAPILSADALGPPRHDRNNFGPSAGLAWSVTKNMKTVVHAGAGIYYDTVLQLDRVRERSIIGPRGNGRFPIGGAFLPNPVPGIPGVPLSRPLSFTAGPTLFTGAHLISVLPALRDLLRQQIGSGDLSVRNIEVFKQGVELIPRDFPMPYSEHVSAGVQRELAPDLVVSADFAFRQFMHTTMPNVDYNRWDNIRGPVIRTCAGAEILDPTARCSAGAIGVHTPGGRSHYKGLLLKLDKRYSRRVQFLAAYALSSNVGFNGIVNKEDWFESFGPLNSDRRHVLNLSGIIELPRSLKLSFISSFSSRPPFAAYIAAIDLDGDGSNDEVLPGSRFNQLNRGLGKRDLTRLVLGFNTKFAGRQTPRGQSIPSIVLPARYELGDGFCSQDVRLSRAWTVRERYAVTLFGEVFNVLNIANLLGYSGNLAESASFGQPTYRVQQVFGTGGPRAFQFGARVSF